jgi:hypothetical protein
VGNVKIPYYVVPKGKKSGYWRPNAKMRELGFRNICCGKDGPRAWKIAESWNAKWQAVRQGKNIAPVAAANLSPTEAEERTIYPDGSIGAAFSRYRRSKAWTIGKASRTREDWWRAWRFIKPIFGDVDPATIEPEHIEDWRQEVLEGHGLDAAHRATKIWRALWKVMAAYKMCQRDMDPSANTRNTAPKGRTAIFSEGEAVRRVKRAIRMGFPGLACIMAIAWDTQFSPVDCRTLTPNDSCEDENGVFFVKYRAKTKDTDEDAIEAVGTLSKRTQRLIEAYLSWQGTELMPDATMFRNRSGTPYTKDTLGRDFRRVRNVEAPGCRKVLLDFRRSGAVEATAGNVEPLALAQKMANSIDTSKRLQETYIPKRAALVRLADEARRRGRQKLRGNKRA